MKFEKILLLLFLVSLVVGFTNADNLTKTIEIGGLLPLTGDLSSHGPTYKTAMELATEELNAKYLSLGYPYQVHLHIEDTGSDPQIALEKGKLLINEGISFIIGPESSAETQALEETAKESGTLLIGFGSTTPGISTPENTIIRLCPDDNMQAQALAGLFKKKQYSTIVPVVRDDIYGQKLYELLKNESEKGNFTLTNPVTYSPDTKDFNKTTTLLAQSIRDIQSKSNASAGKTAVLCIGLNEGVAILASAADTEGLDTIPWMGTDGIALSDSLMKDPKVADFAIKTHLIATIFGELENEKSFMDFSAEVTAKSGLRSTPYAVVIDDAVQLAALSSIMSQGISDKKPIFVDIARHFYGVTGLTYVTDSGDRKFANIDYWGLQKEDGNYSWEKEGRFVNQMAGPMVDMKKNTSA